MGVPYPGPGQCSSSVIDLVVKCNNQQDHNLWLDSDYTGFHRILMILETPSYTMFILENL